MKNVSLFLLSFILVISFAGCDPSDDSDTVNNAPVNISDAEFAKNFGAITQRDFIGQVVDRDNEPVVGASVKIGSSTVQTDANGVFIINDAEVYEKFAYITATKNGYVNGSRSMVPTNGKNNVRIMLIPSTPVQTIASGASATVNLPNGTQVVFDGAFADENGNAYTGNVNVSMFHLESSDANIGSLMPGMLYAKSELGQPVGLETFGMMHVELRGSGGQKLQIASGHSAQMTMPIDNSQLAISPATIPLWHFDETNGYWKQEGFATKQGNKYMGYVSHFSWWNCDAPFQQNYLTVIVKDSTGQPLKNIGVGISVPNVVSEKVAHTNDQGKVCGIVPANQTLQVKIYDPCGNLVKAMTLESTNPSIETAVIIEPTEITSVLVKGKLVKCDGSNVTNGYVFLEYGNLILLSEVSNGTFQFTAAICDGISTNGFKVRAYDVDNLQSTGELNYQFTPGTTDLGIVPVCNAMTEYIVFQIDGYEPNYIFEDIDTFPVPGSQPLTIRCTNTPNLFFAVAGTTTTPGVYTGSGIQIGLTQFEGWGFHSYNFVSEPPGSFLKIEILKYGNVGDYIDIRFYGTGMSGGNPVILNGYIHVIRD